MNKIVLALTLAWVAGFADSLGYLALSQIFTAHMSGNAAAVGAQLGGGEVIKGLTAASVIPGFVGGVCLGALTEFAARRAGSRHPLAYAFVLEIALLVFFALFDSHGVTRGTWRFFMLAEALALAMGVQSATLRRAGHLTLNTTFITGMLTNMAEETMRYFLSFVEPARPPPKERSEAAWHARVYGGIFLMFMVGAICGGYSERVFGPRALGLPALVLAVLACKTPTSRRAPREAA